MHDQVAVQGLAAPEWYQLIRQQLTGTLSKYKLMGIMCVTCRAHTWRQLLHDEVREDSVWLQGSHCRAGEDTVEGPQTCANEVEEGPGGQGQAPCQAHGLQQLLCMHNQFTPT